MTTPHDDSDDNSIDVGVHNENPPDDVYPRAVSAMRAETSRSTEGPLTKTGRPGTPAEQVVATKAICDGVFALEHLEAVYTIIRTLDRPGVKMDNTRQASASHLECVRDYVQKAVGAVQHATNTNSEHSDLNTTLSQDFISSHETLVAVQDTLGDLIHKQPSPQVNNTTSTIADEFDSNEESNINIEGVSNWEETVNTADSENYPATPTVDELRSVATDLAEAVVRLNVGLAENYGHIITSPEEKPQPAQMESQDEPVVESHSHSPQTPDSNTPPSAADDTSLSEYVPTAQTSLLQTA
ncbi:hypothetical protein EXE48_11685 [Halorubrum sp. ASP1]|uniref:hypothetical protein n=1 Tax=Halorubrum sp. ASP1 TaxID=2518114 RepID=UPI0010F5091D|nr:hypothetical protein [Halorubrum sp. ASP1]TKX60626.1 hypothetical protein EXE48_11685 [Halorubrum sp. ASP1]